MLTCYDIRLLLPHGNFIIATLTLGNWFVNHFLEKVFKWFYKTILLKMLIVIKESWYIIHTKEMKER